MTDNVWRLVNDLRKVGGDPYLVGGYVRDFAMDRRSKDIDVEVFGLSPKEVREALENAPYVHRIEFVGVSYGVFKVTFGEFPFETIDVSLPRTERKRGTGHQGFDVVPSPALSLAEAVQRRDFTINALMLRPAVEGGDVAFFDPTGRGMGDLRTRVLRHVGPQFADDPLRVLRGMQFASRFDMTMDPRTADLCEGLIVEAQTLSIERIWGEWEKWARGVKPSRGLDVLDRTNWVLLWPELAVLMITPQDKEWHPEGNVWEHTRHAVDEAAIRAIRDELNEEDTVVLVFAALLHDIGKPATTEVLEDGRITSPGHAEEGVLIADMFLRKIGAPDRVRERVVGLVGEHMWGADGKLTSRSVRRLARRLAARHNTVLDLVRLMDVDRDARPPKPRLGSPVAAALMDEAEHVNVLTEGPKPILMGRHLIERGFQPGPEMGTILKCAFERQLDGEFDSLDGAIAWLATRKGCTHVDPS